jgi:hypothetical protein
MGKGVVIDSCVPPLSRRYDGRKINQDGKDNISMAKGVRDKKRLLVDAIVTSLEYKSLEECKLILLYIAQMDKRDSRPYENAKS